MLMTNTTTSSSSRMTADSSSSPSVVVLQGMEELLPNNSNNSRRRHAAGHPLSTSSLSSPPPPVTATVLSDEHNNNNNNDADAATVATTVLANEEVGSVVRAPKDDACLRSLTFFKHHHDPASDIMNDWSIELADPPAATATTTTTTNHNNNHTTPKRQRSLLLLSTLNRHKKKKYNNNNNKNGAKLSIQSMGGHMMASLSSPNIIQPGDLVKSINGKRIMSPRYNAARAVAYMHERYQTDGVLSLAVTNPAGSTSDVLVQATVLKPRPNMTYQQLGMVVWHWGVLCIKQIKQDSLFRHSILREEDEILSINDIDCTDGVTPEGFAHILTQLPLEVTIQVRRGKERWTGRFG